MGWSLFSVADSIKAEEDGFVPMFNGKDLSGWVNANCAPETWSVKDGVIRCTGKPIGALRTERQYENFIIEAEWRHLSSGGNSGVFIWGTPISAPGQPFLRGIEVQVLDHGYMKHADPTKPRWFTTHGDVFPIHGATMKPHGDHSGSRSFPSEERSKPSPEWNHYRIECKAGRLTLAVNGKVVSGGDDCIYRKGYLALESEGAPVEFRNVRIKELPSSGAGPEVTAPVDEGWKCLYNGVDFRGWKLPAGGEGKWKSSDWQIQLAAGGGQAGSVLWSEHTVGNGSVIVDVSLPKNADLTQPCAGICLRGEAKPLVVFGKGDAPIVFDASKAKPGQWYRVRLELSGTKVQATLMEREEKNPQTVAAEVPGLPASGAVGLADLGHPASFGNINVAEKK